MGAPDPIIREPGERNELVLSYKPWITLLLFFVLLLAFTISGESLIAKVVPVLFCFYLITKLLTPIRCSYGLLTVGTKEYPTKDLRFITDKHGAIRVVHKFKTVCHLGAFNQNFELFKAVFSEQIEPAPEA